MPCKSTPLLCAALFFAFVLSSCLREEVQTTSRHYTDDEFRAISKVLDLPLQQHSYQVELARHMLQAGAQPPVIDDARATLGRVLFYDPGLSRTRTVSCASCHKQELAFSDDVPLSKGFSGQLTKRNSLALAATANFSSSYDQTTSLASRPLFFFWDERAHSIAEQSIQTIEDEIEMGMNLQELSARLQQEDYYPILFRKAFGDTQVTPERIVGALQEFCNSFLSAGSRFDEVLNENPAHRFTSVELRGRALYNQHCGSCHSFDMTTATMAVANNGLDDYYEDQGLGALSGDPAEMGLFKVPFLRNIALTAPYMHDGRFNTLEEVIEHYSSGIRDHENLSPELRNGNDPVRFNFSDSDKQALLEFLHTLTDHAFIQDERFSDPFLQ